MWHLPSENFNLAIESLNKVKRLKKTECDWREAFQNEKLISKWEINIKDTLKTSGIWKLNVYF